MSTNSLIARENIDGSLDAIYCHWDGYPEHHMPILNGHYTTQGKVDALIELGDLSALAEEIGSKHSFDSYETYPTWCIAYGRDRDEHDLKARHFSDRNHLEECAAEPYIYIFLSSKTQWLFYEKCST